VGADLVSALVSAAIALIVAFPLGGALKRQPAPFYLVALALVVTHLWYRFAGMYVPGAQVLIDVMQKAYLACAFLAIVMFIGVLDEQSAARRRLQPIRAELSILSFVLALGHTVVFLPSYLPHFSTIFLSHPGMAASIIVAILLEVIYAVLTVTSLHVLRVHMPYHTWKSIQRLSYAMVALLYAHILLALGRSAFLGHGSSSAQLAIVLYTLTTLAYVVLRVRKALRTRAAAGTPSRAR
jgi:sulfoxide reductase heme-binding subunit YedZ